VNLSEELVPYSAAQKQNRLLLEGDGLDDGYDDGFSRKNGGGGGGLLGQGPLMNRNAKRLIMEEDEEDKEAQPPAARSGYTAQQKSNLAQYIYRTQLKDSRSPWQKLDDRMKAKAQTAKNVQGMFGGESGDTLGFGKLFGQKSNWRSGAKAAREEKSIEDTGKEVDGEFKPAKGIWGAVKRFWWRFRNRGLANNETNSSVGFRQAAIGPKMSWMQRLFGARRDPDRFANSAKGLGIKKPKAQGWADQLVDASEAGKLDEGRDASEKLLAAPGPQRAVEEEKEAQHKSYETYNASEEEEEKQPPVVSKQPLLNAKDAKRNSLMENLYTMQNMVGNQQADEDGDPHQTIDDNSIDEDEDEDSNGGYDPKLVTNFMHNAGKGEGNEEMKSLFHGYITSIFNKT
jgi:hypothetical protein